MSDLISIHFPDTVNDISNDLFTTDMKLTEIWISNESLIKNNETLKDIIVKTIIFAIAFEFIYLAAVLLIVIFVPKVHTVEDIKAYFEVPVWEKK